MNNKNKDFLGSLRIESEKDLQRYILNKLLEFSESDKPEHRIMALKELSRYSFPSNIHYQSSISSFFNNDSTF